MREVKAKHITADSTKKTQGENSSSVTNKVSN